MLHHPCNALKVTPVHAVVTLNWRSLPLCYIAVIRQMKSMVRFNKHKIHFLVMMFLKIMLSMYLLL